MVVQSISVPFTVYSAGPFRRHFGELRGILPVDAHAEVNILNLNYITAL